MNAGEGIPPPGILTPFNYFKYRDADYVPGDAF